MLQQLRKVDPALAMIASARAMAGSVSKR